MITAATVNRELKTLGVSERLVKGNGYWYFTEGNAHNWRSTMVLVNRVADLDLDSWMIEYKALSEDVWNIV